MCISNRRVFKHRVADIILIVTFQSVDHLVHYMLPFLVLVRQGTAVAQKVDHLLSGSLTGSSCPDA